MTKPEPNEYGYIRDLRGRHTGGRAVILAKGPSLDVWWSRGGCGSERDSWVVMAINEIVLLPGLKPNYWFWPHPEHAEQVNRFGADLSGTTQLFDEFVLRTDPEFCAEQVKRCPSLVHLRGVDAPDDPYAVPKNATSGSAAFFCAGLWGIREVLAVGFDGMDRPYDKRYAHCLLPFTIEQKHSSLSYKGNNRVIKICIERFDLDVTWYHRQVTDAEIDEAGESFELQS